MAEGHQANIRITVCIFMIEQIVVGCRAAEIIGTENCQTFDHDKEGACRSTL